MTEKEVIEGFKIDNALLGENESGTVERNNIAIKCIEELQEYRSICDSPEKLKLIDELYLEICEEINRLNKIIKVLVTKLLNTEFGRCYMCKNPMKNIMIDGVNNGCDGECNTTEESSVEDFLKKFIAELERIKEVQDVN